MERKVCPGEFYRHFKNRLYQVLAVAVHSETGEPMVVYQALYGDYKVYVRPYAMFVSEVDHEKYPDVVQRYRFERVMPDGGEMDDGADSGTWQPAEPDRMAAGNVREESAPQEPNPVLLRFLDTDDYEEQMACLKQLEKSASQSDVDSLYVVLDMKPIAGDIGTQLRGIARFLSLRDHFDGRRLR